MKKTAFLIWAASLIVITGCSSSQTRVIPATTQTTTTTVTTTSTSKDITIANFQFSPAAMEIAIGETVTRTNNDTMPHTILADDDSFQSTALQQGESFSFTFNEAGVYSYHCSIHPSMKAEITVK